MQHWEATPLSFDSNEQVTDRPEAATKLLGLLAGKPSSPAEIEKTIFFARRARTARITEPPLAEQDQAGCPEAITWEQIAGSSSAGHVSDDTVVPEEFIPGQHYVCGVDGCCFAVVLHEGSKKFWCALCHSRHKIVDNKIIRAKGPPISVTMYNQVLSARALWKK
ncbi:hypothetical protein MRX96_010007 [Rhipicephalus microplus]